MIDAKLSSKRKTPAAGKVKVQTSGRDKNEYVEKLHAKLSTKRPCEQEERVDQLSTQEGEPTVYTLFCFENI